jgi:two-component system cell cycle sensor histidine kinase/response regulator CckA
MAEERIRVLMVEESPSDARLVQHALTSEPARFNVTHVENLAQALDCLARAPTDVILLGLGVSDSQGFEALATFRRAGTHVPIVVLTAHSDETLAMRALQQGAQDYLPKPEARGPLLTRTIRYAIERERHEEALRDSEGRLRQLADNIPSGFIYQLLQAPDGKVGFTYCSAGVEALLGITPAETVADPMLLFRLIHEDDHARVWALNEKVFREGIPFDCEFRERTRAGEIRWIHCKSTPRPLPHGGSVWDGLAVDVTARVRAEEERRKLALLVEGTTDFVGTFDADRQTLYVNRAGRALCGIAEADDLTGTSIVDFHTPRAGEFAINVALPAAARDGFWTGETALRHRDGTEVPASQVILAHFSATNQLEYFSTIIRDLSEYKRLQEQFLHAQKMEAVGRLAGGVAHDFNNMLTVVRGYGESLLSTLPAGTPEHAAAREIARAATMAAALTRQLLAFSRREDYLPVQVNLNQVLNYLDRMLRRVMPETVALETRPAAEARLIRADAAQLGQVIMNLAINARDAMPDGGKLVIETANADVSESASHGTGAQAPGPYTLLRVSDTGTGMSPEVKARIFDPFFTTKPKGQGSGLGLATVFGIVKQCGGFIEVASEPGRGSTFTVFLPSVVPEGAAAAAPATSSSHVGDVILLAEGETKIRVLARTILHKAGYRVLEARDAAEALHHSAQHSGPLHLLLGDIALPGMGGVALARELSRQRPDLKVLLTARRPDEMATPPEEWARDIARLQKPYDPDLLVRAVEAILSRQMQGK